MVFDVHGSLGAEEIIEMQVDHPPGGAIVQKQSID